MSASIDQRVQERAHALWEKEGHPEGRSEEFWYRALSEIESEDEAPQMPVSSTPNDGGVDVHPDDSFPASDPPSHSVIVGPSS